MESERTSLSGGAVAALIASLSFLAATCIASTTFLIYVDKPYVAISSTSSAVVGALVAIAAFLVRK